MPTQDDEAALALNSPDGRYASGRTLGPADPLDDRALTVPASLA